MSDQRHISCTGWSFYAYAWSWRFS
jgi:hypothetical protein